MTRTDAHRPSAINPEEYDFVSFHDHRPDAWAANLVEQRVFRSHRERTGGNFSGHDHGGVCHICGNANAMSVARFHHRPSNTYIEVGETCAHKLDDGEATNFRAFRERAAAGIAAAAGRRKAEGILRDAGLEAAWAVFAAENDGGHEEEATVRDIVAKLVRYGSISDAQINFLRSLLDRIARRAEIAAQRAAEQEAAAPVPVTDERVEVVAEIVSTRVEEGPYGTVAKALFRHATGYKLWGTLPTAIAAAQRGDTVKLTARITVSDRDPKFGFINRPSKASFVEKKPRKPTEAEAQKLAYDDWKEKFPAISPENFDEAGAYIKERLAYHLEHTKL